MAGNNPTGKGGFGERPQDINKGGAPRKGQSWSETIKRLTDMTRDEAIAYVGGAKTRLGRLLKELPANVPIKDALILAYIIQFGREPSASFLAGLADREDGKPKQAVSLTGEENAPPIVVKVVRASDVANSDE